MRTSERRNIVSVSWSDHLIFGEAEESSHLDVRNPVVVNPFVQSLLLDPEDSAELFRRQQFHFISVLTDGFQKLVLITSPSFLFISCWIAFLVFSFFGLVLYIKGFFLIHKIFYFRMWHRFGLFE